MTVSWLFCRWPYQKGVATQLDQIQIRMMSMSAQIHGNEGEPLEDFWKRKKTAGRKLAGDIGFWSEIWRKRVLEWDAHVERSIDRGHINAMLRQWHDSTWLQARRLEWVYSSGGRNTPFAGRLGTRAFGGQP